MFSQTFEQAPQGRPVISTQASKAEGKRTVAAAAYRRRDYPSTHPPYLRQKANRSEPTICEQFRQFFPPSYPQCCCAGGRRAAPQHHG